MYRLGQNDFVKGIVTAVFAAAITTIYGFVSQDGFDVFAAEWGVIFGDVVQVSVSTMAAYLMKNFVTDENGRLGGVI